MVKTSLSGEKDEKSYFCSVRNVFNFSVANIYFTDRLHMVKRHQSPLNFDVRVGPLLRPSKTIMLRCNVHLYHLRFGR